MAQIPIVSVYTAVADEAKRLVSRLASGDRHWFRSALDVEAGPLTTPGLSLSATYNSSGTVMPGALSIDVTNTASAANSLLARIRCDNSTVFSVAAPYGRVYTSEGFSTVNAGTHIFGTRSVFGAPGVGGLSIGKSDGTATVGLYAASNHVLELRDGANAQTFSIYNTQVGSDYERGFLKWSGNWFNIGTEIGGSGTNRGIALISATGFIAVSGTTSSYPGIKRSSATIAFRLADDSADCAISAANINLSGYSKSTPVTVANLPSASTSGNGARHFVTDASTTLMLGLGGTVTGGGSNSAPVFSDGTNWRYG